MVKWVNIKKGVLIRLKTTETVNSKNPYARAIGDYKYILVISEPLFKDHVDRRKRHFYFKACFYDDLRERVFVEELDRSMLRSHMKIIDDDKLAKKIFSTAIIEAI